MNDILRKILYYAPRAIVVLGVLFMMVFSVDCFDGADAWYRKLLCFGMHNIPALVMVLFLWLAWNYELAGGIVLIVLALLMAWNFDMFTTNRGGLVVMLPFVVAGLLFVVNGLLKPKG